MVSKNQIKHISALHQKKFRHSHGLFIAEGAKVIQELLDAGFEYESIFVSEPHFESIPDSHKTFASASELKKLSALTTPNNCLAVFKIPAEKPIVMQDLIVALDQVRDPGNLGTIIRLCDWFGISQIVCSSHSADLFNPKVVQASMGSIARVNVVYRDLAEFLSNLPIPVYGTFMDGENIYKTSLAQNAVIVLGNEANGISPEVERCVSQKLAVPRFGALHKTESLNVATAAAVILSEFRRTQA